MRVLLRKIGYMLGLIEHNFISKPLKKSEDSLYFPTKSFSKKSDL